MLGRCDFDLVAIGRALIANPDRAEKVYAGQIDQLVAYEPKSLETLL
jgi:2,4-dienoyl-CoA reductase-like NADH-dependent reductase (Old Yellow Enzyme family)